MKKNNNLSFQKLILLIILLLPISSTSAQKKDNFANFHRITKQYIEWAEQSDTWFEGCAKTIAGTKMQYHSPLPTVNEALITRATTGLMEIEWETQTIPENFSGKYVTFVWLAGLGSNLGEKEFRLFFNNEHLLSFSSSAKLEWRIKGKNKTKLNFKAIKKDAAKDLFGYMFFTVPTFLLKKNQSQTIRVVGVNAGSPAWFMLFIATDLVEKIQKATNGFWYRLTWENNSPNIIAEFPITWGKKTLRLKDQGDFDFTAKIKANMESSLATFPLKKNSKFPITIQVDGKSIDSLNSLNGEWIVGEVLEDRKIVMREKSINNSKHVLESSKNNMMNITEGIHKGLSYFKNGAIHLITSSHQDIAWMDSPESCVIQRDTLIITPALKMLAKDPSYHYSAEQALMLQEYLSRHPDKKELIHQFTKEGRLEWGATYNQPYEGMYSGESLIRQLYFGRKWIKKTLPGCDSRLAWNLDVPGRTLQMPQILKKSGVNYLLLSRHEKGFFYWQSPDGSRVGAHSPGHYHWASDHLRQSTFEAFDATAKLVASWEPEYRKYKISPDFPSIFSSDMSGPTDFGDLMSIWNNLKLRRGDGKKITKTTFPVYKYAIAEPALDRIFTDQANLPVIQGERPNVWLYIHGPTHHKAISASREASRLLTAAEKFCTIDALLKNNLELYPAQELSQAWNSHIYPDHGWGGNNGHITDSLFRAKSEFARDAGKKLLLNSIQEISKKVKTNSKMGEAILVFNDLSWERDDPVSIDLNFKKGQAHGIKILDALGKQVDSELSGKEFFEDRSLRKAKINFIARNIPSIGYQTYYAKLIKKASSAKQRKILMSTLYENDFYKITFTDGGIKQIFDKQLEQNLLRTDKFLGGELFTMKSEGNGAGEFAEVQQPTMDGFDKVSNYSPKWKQISNSQVAAVFVLEQKLTHCTFRQQVTVYNNIKRIDFDVDLLNWDGTKNREFRLAFPLNQDKAKVTYEVPFGKVTVGEDEIPGAAGERYVQPAADVHPREVQDWINSSDAQFGFTMASGVAVCDYIDPTDSPVEYPIIQPLLLASRKSCHGLGNWYLQEGDHFFHFSLFSHESGWQNGYRLGKQPNHPLQAVAKTESTGKEKLPSEKSFCSLENSNIIISTIKKCDDDNTVILRSYEMEGKDSDVVVNWFTPVIRIERTNLIEEEGKILPLKDKIIQMKVGHNAIEAVKIFPGK